MDVYVNEMKQRKRILDSLKNSYENLLLNYYNHVKNLSFVWQSNKADSFSAKTNDEKADALKISNCLNQYIAIIDYLIKYYSEIGNKIVFNLNNKDNVVSSYNKYMDYLQNLINTFGNLDTDGFNAYEISTVNSIKNEYKRELQVLVTSKSNFLKLIDKINKIELKIDKLISEMIIPKIGNNDDIQISNKAHRDVVISLPDDIENIKDKLKSLKNEETSIIDELNDFKNYIEQYYSTNNTNNLKANLNMINDNLVTINYKHYNNINELLDEIDEVRLATKQNLESIDKFEG